MCDVDVENYTVGSKLGNGAYGEVYEGTHTLNGTKEAIKIEILIDVDEEGILRQENKIYKLIQGCPGIPVIKQFEANDSYNTMAMELLGSSLEDLRILCKNKLSLNTVLVLGRDMINVLENIHSKGVIHCDLKPDNILMGRGSKHGQVHLIDFGIAQIYRDLSTLEHITQSENNAFAGTNLFASICAHTGTQLTRRDDLETLGYVLIYLLKGTLPWEDDTKKEVLEKKRKISIQDLCEGFPEFEPYFKYVRKLTFSETPDYSYLKSIFDNHLPKTGVQKFCWESLNFSDRSIVQVDVGNGQETEGITKDLENLNI